MKLRETDLYKPVHDYLAAQGYTVHGEVKGCDITAMKDGELIVVELKTGFNLKLLVQAAKRQRLGDSVYVAVPRPKGGKRGAGWRDMCFLLRRLELGLIIVTFSKKGAGVEVVIHPEVFDQVKSKQVSKRKRYSVIKEMETRYGDFNEGGSTRRKLMTAYRENSIHIACCLEKFGPLKPVQLRKLGTGDKTLSILSKNFYGWFERVNQGIYGLTQKGAGSLDEFPELTAHYRSKVSEAQVL